MYICVIRLYEQFHTHSPGFGGSLCIYSGIHIDYIHRYIYILWNRIAWAWIWIPYCISLIASSLCFTENKILILF